MIYSRRTDDAALWQAFTSRTLSQEGWTHRAHVRVAWMHLQRWPELDEAHLRMRVGIIRLNTFHGLEETPARGYHETITRGWLAVVRNACAMETMGDSLAFLERHPSLLDKNALLRHYTRELLISLAARSVFVPPDVAPF